MSIAGVSRAHVAVGSIQALSRGAAPSSRCCAGRLTGTSAAFSSQASVREVWKDASAAQVAQRLDAAHPAAGKVVLLDFSATWCPPCHMLSPILERVAERTNTDLLVVDVDKEPQLSAQFKVRAMPTVVALREGKEVSRFVGAQGEAQVTAFLSEASK